MDVTRRRDHKCKQGGQGRFRSKFGDASFRPGQRAAGKGGSRASACEERQEAGVARRDAERAGVRLRAPKGGSHGAPQATSGLGFTQNKARRS